MRPAPGGTSGRTRDSPGRYSKDVAQKARFVCKHCKRNGRIVEIFHQMNKIVSQIGTAPGGRSWSDAVKSFPAELQATKEEMNKNWGDNCKILKDELNSIKANISSGNSSCPTAPLVAIQLRQSTSELLDVESRKLSLVVSGLPEGGKDIEDLLEFYNVHHETTRPLLVEDIEATVRVGKQGPQVPHRLLKVKVRSHIIKKNLLLIHLAKKSSAPAVYIRPDLTKTQQELDKKLRDELKIKGKDSFKIFRGKIVPRIISSNENSSPQTELHTAVQPSTKVPVKPATKTLTLPAVAKPIATESLVPVKQAQKTSTLPTMAKLPVASSKSSVLTKPTTSTQSTAIINSANNITVLQSVTESSNDTDLPIVLLNKVDIGAALSESAINQSSFNEASRPSIGGNMPSDQLSLGSFAISSDLGQSSPFSASSDLDGASAAVANLTVETDSLESWTTVPEKSQKSKSLSKASGKTV